MLFHNFAGVRRKNLETAQYPVCPPFEAKTARQRRLMLQISFSNNLQPSTGETYEDVSNMNCGRDMTEILLKAA